MRQTTLQPARHPHPTARAIKLAHLIFHRLDLDRAETFLGDFGLTVAERGRDRILARAADESPYCYRVHRDREERFVGFGLLVGDRAELAALGKFPGASPISEVTLPGGEQVALPDPSGFTVEAVWNQAKVEPLPERAPMTLSAGGQRRRVNAGQRPAMEPPRILELGHVVLDFADCQKTVGWYTEHFGLIPSDGQLLPDVSPSSSSCGWTSATPLPTTTASPRLRACGPSTTSAVV